ncbi:MAG TPA: D-glucuronyl C5-epimerase family protein [Thermoleophilaceae bacterium]|nr:D-glucuronyl C5-epimerase family protein [Thermoleophilaceae bacterium]
MTFRRSTLWTSAAVCLALVAVAPAQAGDLLLVGGGERAQRVDDALVPDGAAVDVGREAALRVRSAAASRAKSSPATRLPRAAAASRRSARERRAARRARQATSRALTLAYKRRAISRASYLEYRRVVTRARAVQRRLKGARKAELGNAIALVDGMALQRKLTASRLPALMLILRRNTQYWPRQPFPADRDHVMFRGSRLIFEYYVGEGLQLQPLVNFKQANLMHGACVKDTGLACDRAGLRKLLGELIRTASTRGGFKTWEYYFEFGGGRPPWISGMAQATAIQAFARASQLLADPSYLKQARAAFGAFRKPPPVGVRTSGPFGGVHYLQYSFAPGLYIINAFLQSLIGLYDYAEITGDRAARKLFADGEPEARRELPANDTGDWSTYSYRGAESTREYHELLREFSASMCSRLHRDRDLREPYCVAARDFLGYTTDPAELELLGPSFVTKGVPANVRFSVSKLSAVQVTITRNGAVALDKLGTYRRGTWSLPWKPGAAGDYRIRVAAKELRTGKNLRSSVTGVAESSLP